MAYQRKTRDVFALEQHTPYGQGWEEVTEEATRAEARKRLREYRENQPEFPVRIRCRRERIQQQGAAS